MDIFKKDEKAKKRFLLLKTLFILSGLLQGVSVILTIPLFKYLFLYDLDKAILFIMYIGISSLLCFIFHFTGTNIGNHMAVWEVCDSKTHEIGTAIIKLPLGWFDSSSKGKVSKAISTDANTLGHYPPIVLPEILTVISSSIVVSISLFFISFKYALVIILTLPIIFYFWRKNIQALESIEEENVIANQKMESRIVEFAQLQAVLRASGVLMNGWDRLDKALSDDKSASVKTLKKKGKNSFKYMLVINLATILILILSALELKNGVIQIYTFVGIVVAMFRFANPLSGLLAYMSEVFNVKSALKRINSITNAKRLEEPLEDVDVNMEDGISIELKNINFSYVKGTEVLHNVNLKIAPKTITALVGASGSGKSTINKIIARFWDVDSGEVLINGINIKAIKTEKLMSMISMVFQEVYLFNTSIRENLSIANPSATEEEILNAAKKARLDEVIDRLPNGWNTIVGEGGSSLSGGEKQRVSIARAFLKNAPILLLDEITSALDGVNEAIITKSIEELSKDKTVIVIAHRLSSIKNADKIAVVDDGEIIAYDSHENLLNNNEQYMNLWKSLVGSNQWTI